MSVKDCGRSNAYSIVFFLLQSKAYLSFVFFLEPAGGENTLSRPYRDFPAGMISRTGELPPSPRRNGREDARQVLRG